MPASPNIYVPLNFNQLFDLVKQLPAKEKNQLIGLLTQEQEDTIPEWQTE